MWVVHKGKYMLNVTLAGEGNTAKYKKQLKRLATSGVGKLEARLMAGGLQ